MSKIDLLAQLSLEQMREGVFADGTTFADLQAAIQAAWLAGDPHLAGVLAFRYGLWDFLCLRCAKPCESIVDRQFRNARDVEHSRSATDAALHVCTECFQQRLNEHNGKTSYVIAGEIKGRLTFSDNITVLVARKEKP